MNGRPGLIIRAVTQSAQSPDFNESALSFFKFPQVRRADQIHGQPRFDSDITKAVRRCYAEYPAGR